MDYTGWELERQRRALAALLLGGGTAEDEDAVRERERRNPEVRPARGAAAWEQTAGGDGDFAASSFEGEGLRAWDAIQAAERIRLAGFGRPEVPGSIWEGIPGAEAASWQSGRDAETDTPAGFQGIVHKDGAVFPDVAAVSSAEAISGGKAFRQANQEAGGRSSAKTLSDAFGRGAGSGEAGEEWFPKAVRGGGKALRALSQGGEAGSRAQSGQPVIQVLEETAGIGFQGGSFGGGALQAEDSARALSLAVQRDARRYDGGFTIY